MHYTHDKSWCAIAVLLICLGAVLPSCSSNPDKNIAHTPKISPTAQVPSLAFGKVAWEHYFGDDVGEEPVLPSNIDEILDGPCPFWPGKKVKDTHLLALIPATVSGEPFTLDSLEELVKSPKRGHCTNYQPDYGLSTVQKYFEATARPHKHAYWVLMTRDVLPESLNKMTYGEQQDTLRDVQQQQSAYMLPSVLEAATTILTHYVRSGERCCTRTYTHCEEKIDNTKPVLVGGFSESNRSLTICYNHGRCVIPQDEGFALLRRLS